MREVEMQPVFWKLSMGPGTAGEDFKTVLQLLDWVRRGVVLVHKDTKAKGTSQTSQGEHFVEAEREGDYFYLCHGNSEPAVILFGQYSQRAQEWSAFGQGRLTRSRSSKSHSHPIRYRGNRMSFDAPACQTGASLENVITCAKTPGQSCFPKKYRLMRSRMLGGVAVA